MSVEIADRVETDRPWQNERVLRHLYHNQELTTREIADELGVVNSTITKWLQKHDIETRENWKVGVEAAKEANRVEYADYRTLPKGYEYWGSKESYPDSNSRTSEIVYVHRLLAVAEYGFKKVADADVHHKNGVPWDNRAKNITVLSKAEHTRRGNDQRISNQDLLVELRRLADELDHRPTTGDLRELGKYSYPTYKQRFGGWAEALDAAKITGGGGE